MTAEEFKQLNEFLARLIYDPNTPDKMKEAAKDARRSLHRLFGTNDNPVRRGRRQRRTQNPASANLV
jgi:hypothetical protein